MPEHARLQVKDLNFMASDCSSASAGTDSEPLLTRGIACARDLVTAGNLCIHEAPTSGLQRLRHKSFSVACSTIEATGMSQLNRGH